MELAHNCCGPDNLHEVWHLLISLHTYELVSEELQVSLFVEHRCYVSLLAWFHKLAVNVNLVVL